MRYSVLYVQPRPSFFNPKVTIYENKVHIIDDVPDEAKARLAAEKFLAGRQMISLLPIHLPTGPIAQPKPEFLHDVSGSET